MTHAVAFPACPKCGATFGAALCNSADFAPCPVCGLAVQVLAFPSLGRPPQTGDAGERRLIEGESACFYHDNKKAVVVCDACGRFLCALCDVALPGEHLCPGCLEAGKRKKTIEQLEDSRPLYGRQALLLSIVPLGITGLIALLLCWLHWRTPGSLVQPARWQMPVALALGILQVALVTLAIGVAIWK